MFPITFLLSRHVVPTCRDGDLLAYRNCSSESSSMGTSAASSVPRITDAVDRASLSSTFVFGSAFSGCDVARASPAVARRFSHSARHPRDFQQGVGGRDCAACCQPPGELFAAIDRYWLVSLKSAPSVPFLGTGNVIPDVAGAVYFWGSSSPEGWPAGPCPPGGTPAAAAICPGSIPDAGSNPGSFIMLK